MLHFTRNCLLASSIRAYLSLGSWGRKDLLAMEDLLEVVKPNKRDREEDVEQEAIVVVA